jgi:hypothetical protein
LRYIARDLGLRDARIIGRNWQGHQSPNRWIRMATKLMDTPIRPIPALCSFLYLIGHKPA